MMKARSLDIILVRSVALATALLLAFQACHDHIGPSPAPAFLRKVPDGDGQSAPAGSAVSNPPAVIVLDADSQPVAGVPVRFAVTSGGGAVTGGIDTTDLAGAARVASWTLGPRLGTNTAIASVAGLAPVTFTATAFAPADWVVTKQAGDGQTTTVLTSVASPPAVRVSDGQGNPVPGVVVVFDAPSGAAGLTNPSPTTDGDGIAAVGAWTLKAQAGANILTATVAGLPGVTFTATGVAGPAILLTKQAGDNTSATVGSPVTPAPAALVSDAYGNPVSGAAVSFTVASGGGSIAGPAATSGASGVAAVGSWVLGTSAGTNTLTAAASGVPPVTFTALALPGPAAEITKSVGDNQSAAIGAAVPTPPTVVVKDGYGNGARGTAVTFAVLSGGGSVSGATVNVDATGSARVGGWTLGSLVGTNTLSASVAGLPAVIFTATATPITDPCLTATPYALGSSVSGTLSSGDCAMAGRHTDLYAITVTSVTGAALNLSSNVFYASVSLFDGSGSLVASASDYCDPYYYYTCPGYPYNYPTGSYAGFTVLLAPGSYVLSAGTSDSGAVGAYSLASGVQPEDVTRCAQVWVVAGLTTSQQIEPSDCAASFRSQNYYSDQFVINLTAGRTYTFTMSSTAFDTYLELWDGNGGYVANDDFGGTTNSQITFTPTVSGAYFINAGTYLGNQTGAYTLAIQ